MLNRALPLFTISLASLAACSPLPNEYGPAQDPNGALPIGEGEGEAGEGEGARGGEGEGAGEGEGEGAVGLPHVTPGAADRILLKGVVVTPAQAFDGEVLVVGTTIACVDAGAACEANASAAGATVIDTGAVIAPGLIDTHNHILFDVFDETHWAPQQVYGDHTQWPNDPRYSEMLDVKQCLANDSQGKPAWCAQTPYGTSTGSIRCELDKFGELKGLIAGTTSIVGLPGTSGACFGSLARSIDVAQNGLGSDRIRTSSTFPPSQSTADGVCAELGGSVGAFLVHCGEGTDAKAENELSTLSSVTSTPGCLLAPQTTITHAVAFASTDFASLAQHGVNLTWSPRSNVSLYGATSDIPAALDAGIVVALGPDWSMGGSQNMLDELRFADGWDRDHWGSRLSAQDLVTMATQNGAHALGVDDKLGRLEPGLLADIAVFHGDTSDPFGTILGARPKDVELVMVGGTVLYGDATLTAAAPAAPGCETIDICGTNKFMCVATSDASNKLGQTYADIRSTIETAFHDVDAARPDDGFVFSPPTPLVKCD